MLYSYHAAQFNLSCYIFIGFVNICNYFSICCCCYNICCLSLMKNNKWNHIIYIDRFNKIINFKSVSQLLLSYTKALMSSWTTEEDCFNAIDLQLDCDFVLFSRVCLYIEQFSIDSAFEYSKFMSFIHGRFTLVQLQHNSLDTSQPVHFSVLYTTLAHLRLQVFRISHLKCKITISITETRCKMP